MLVMSHIASYRFLKIKLIKELNNRGIRYI